MAMIDCDLKRISNEDSIRLAAQSDVCYLCARQKAIKEKITITEAYRELMGHKENEKILSITRSGEDICVCFDCLDKLHSKYVIPEHEAKILLEAEEKAKLEEEKAKKENLIKKILDTEPKSAKNVKSKKEAEDNLDKIIAKATKKGSKK